MKQFILLDSHATITGLYVVPIYPRNFLDAIMPYQIHLSKSAKKFMDCTKTKCAQKGIVFKSKIILGSPIIEISDMANNKQFDIVVIGSRGMSSIKETFLGSTLNYVLHKSNSCFSSKITNFNL